MRRHTVTLTDDEVGAIWSVYAGLGDGPGPDALGRILRECGALPDEEAEEWEIVAAEEGWGLFEVHGCGTRDTEWEIERDDEADRFASDDEAQAHVFKRAIMEGSAPHLAALVAWWEADPVEYARRFTDWTRGELLP